MSVNGITTSGQVPITYTKRNVTGEKSKNDNPRTDTLTLTQEAQQFLNTQKELENAPKSKKEEYKDDLQRFLDSLTKRTRTTKAAAFWILQSA